MKRFLSLCSLCLLVMAGGAAQAQEAFTVSSDHNGNGLFTYTFSPGQGSYVFGVYSNSGFISIPSQAVLDTSGPADWVATITESGVTWDYQGQGIVFVGEQPLTFSILSASTTAVLYNASFPEPGPYYRGIVAGDVFLLPDHDPYVVGYNTFSFTGPAVIPEPGVGVLLALGLAGLGRLRARESRGL